MIRIITELYTDGAVEITILPSRDVDEYSKSKLKIIGKQVEIIGYNEEAGEKICAYDITEVEISDTYEDLEDAGVEYIEDEGKAYKLEKKTIPLEVNYYAFMSNSQGETFYQDKGLTPYYEYAKQFKNSRDAYKIANALTNKKKMHSKWMVRRVVEQEGFESNIRGQRYYRNEYK